MFNECISKEHALVSVLRTGMTEDELTGRNHSRRRTSILKQRVGGSKPRMKPLEKVSLKLSKSSSLIIDSCAGTVHCGHLAVFGFPKMRCYCRHHRKQKPSVFFTEEKRYGQ